MKISLLIFSFIGVFAASCIHHPRVKERQPVDSVSTNITNPLKSYPFPYDLGKPSEKIQMPHALTEISGIDVYKKSKLICEQDENGNIYTFDLTQGKIEKTIPFGKDGDYEGIAIVNDTIYVLRSDGKLYQVTNFDSPEKKTTVTKTFLGKENNTEGLCFDKKNYRLLLMCKNDPGSGLKGVRAIYAFDLKAQQLLPNPVYTISLDTVKTFIAKVSPKEYAHEELRNITEPEKGDVSFEPSDLAIHPISGDIYVIATVGKLLVILHPDGSIAFMESFAPTEFKQPEGITFFEDGTMFISDEGRDGKANILKFDYHPK